MFHPLRKAALILIKSLIPSPGWKNRIVILNRRSNSRKIRLKAAEFGLPFDSECYYCIPLKLLGVITCKSSKSQLIESSGRLAGWQAAPFADISISRFFCSDGNVPSDGYPGDGTDLDARFPKQRESTAAVVAILQHKIQ